MKNTRTTEAYRLYYENTLSKDHNNPALIGKWGADPGGFETQIMCRKMGVKIPDSNMYECEGEIFGPARWPYNAGEDPNYSDPPIRYVIKDRMMCIGTTWWNWRNERSIGLGFDFDSIIGHAEGVGVSNEELAKLDEIDVDWIEVIKSTRGGGRHLYIWFDPDNAPITKTHTEHAALARAFIPLIARDTGLDIAANVDVCGSVMWVHHINATKENQGYSLVKPATQILTADHVPPNWRDHVEVVNGSRTKVRVQGWTQDGTKTEGDELDEMTQAHSVVELDETHLKILEDLEATGHSSLWVPDHHLWQGHTAGLKYVFDNWDENGTPMRGLFDTNSLDSDPGKPNCVSGDTKVITREGVKPIRLLAGGAADIITSRGKWVRAPFKSYGEQEVFAITLKNHKRTKVIKATADHRWFVCKYRSDGYRKTKVNFGDRKEVTTNELEHGQIMIQTKPQLNVSPSVVGIQHGMVWGDGTNGGARITSQLALFGDKARDFQKFFAEHQRRPIPRRGKGDVEILNLPYHFKSLVPLAYDKPYLYGWLAGYFATDGCVSEQGSCILRSVDRKAIEHVREICHVLGIESTDITDRYSENGYKPGTVYTTILKASDLEDQFFLLEKHKARFQEATNRQNSYWRVASVEPAGREEVFCCTVPKTGCFCLEDFILSGNCFMRPKPDGAWDVWRFGVGTDECPLWDTNGKYPHTTYNYPATLKQICMVTGGYEGTEEKHGFLFATADELKEALKLLGSSLVLPDRAEGRTLSLHNGPQGKIILVISKDRKDEERDFPRFVKATRGWEIWIRDSVKTSDVEVEEENLWSELDEKIRALKITGVRGSQFDSWVLNDATEAWTLQPRENVKSYLLSLGFGKPDPILGGAVYKSWDLINEPFQPEYPGGRVWNRAAAQFVYAPVELSEGEIPQHPTWTRVMNHCGVELSEYIPELPWGESWGIATGGDYLTAWLACMFQRPFGKLPYLFMYGPQNSGKSSFHESIRLLLTRGVVAADRALTSDQGYNGELEDAVLAVVDEVDISKSGSSTYNKLKEWVTGITISIHAKYKEPKDVRSCLHFVQMSNSRKSLPVFPGDTRITAMNVPSLEEEIPRERLQELLKQEAPHFMRTLMDFTIPEATGRLMLPIIETQGKVEAAAGNVDEVSRFIEDNCYKIPGAAVTFIEFKKKFLDSLEEFQRSEWPDRLILSELDEEFPVGKGARINQRIIGNLTFNDDVTPTKPYSKVEGKVTKEEEE
jgi:hypothetical protein